MARILDLINKEDAEENFLEAENAVGKILSNKKLKDVDLSFTKNLIDESKKKLDAGYYGEAFWGFEEAEQAINKLIFIDESREIFEKFIKNGDKI